MTKLRVDMGLVLATALLAACGGSTNSGGGGAGGAGSSNIPPPVTSVDGSKQLGSLSPSEVQSFCQDLNAFATTESVTVNTQVRCATSAYFAAGGGSGSFNSATCHKSFDDCVAQPPPSPPADAGAGKIDCSKASTSDLMNCTATVAEYNTCLQDTLAPVLTLGTKLCDNPDGGGAMPTNQQPPSCDVVKQKCPSAFTPGSMPGMMTGGTPGMTGGNFGDGG